MTSKVKNSRKSLSDEVFDSKYVMYDEPPFSIFTKSKIKFPRTLSFLSLDDDLRIHVRSIMKYQYITWISTIAKNRDRYILKHTTR